MTKLAALLNTLMLIAVASVLAACGRTPIGEVSGTGGGTNGCQTNADCPAGETCDPGTHTCVPIPGGCNSDADCAVPTPHCRLDTHTCVECTDTSQCPSDETCSNFKCVGFCGAGGACGNGLTCCSPLCVSTQTDPSDCGACGNTCGPYANAAPACIAGGCGIGGCLLGFANCNGVTQDGCEIDTTSNPANCGGCGKACPPGDACSGGVCVGACGPAGCPGNQVCCGALCANTQADNSNCGGCGIVCGPVPQGTTACVTAACRISSCSPGFADCNNQIFDGCEIDTLTDPANCGTCGHNCGPGSTCVAGVCQAGSCAVNGCPGAETCCNAGTTCVDTQNDLKNCGGCNVICPPGSTSCQGGACCMIVSGGMVCGGMVCPGTEQNCGGVCVDETSDPTNCGGCGIICPFGASCVNSMCTSSCNGGPACTGTQQCCPSGCSNTGTDPNNCGGCGIGCGPNEMCVAGMCSNTCNGGPTCPPGTQCCPSGCTKTSGDPNNCGGCGITCGLGSNCVNGMCSATCNGGPACTGSQKCCATGCTDTTTDPKNCGSCGAPCAPADTCVSGICKVPTTCNGGPACSPGQTCCPGTGCADLTTDNNHCGQCATACAATQSCVGGTCAGSEGAFNPIVNPTYLSPGIHNYTTIDIPAGVTVFVAGPGMLSGTLELHATGAIVIDGTVDLSGGPGTQNTITSQSTQSGRAGSGGYTGEPYQSAPPSAACQFIAGNPGLLGLGIQGTPGTCNVLSTTVCVQQSDPSSLLWTCPVAQYGGGAGVFTGYRAYGSGGGGLAGGAPGQLCPAYPGEQDCSGVSAGGGAINGQGGKAGVALYDGKAGISGETQCAGLMPNVPPACVGGGGGGSIGPAAASDLAVLSTFQTGSAGGGGSADYLNRPVFGGTSGGGGGGGALRVSSPVSISIKGHLLTNGGPGGDAGIGNGSNAGCDPQPGAAGGGGSGGVIYLSSPSINVATGAVLSSVGGGGGAQSEFATGGGGGDGGLGRIRLSVTPATCTLSGSFNPPLAAGCNPTGAKAGAAYVGVYPN